MHKRPKQKEGKHKLIGRVIDSFEIPEETVAQRPVISLIGHKEISIENFKNILQYSDILIRLNTNDGVISIKGKKLEAKSMTNEMIKIKGHIEGVLFEE